MAHIIHLISINLNLIKENKYYSTILLSDERRVSVYIWGQGREKEVEGATRKKINLYRYLT